MNGSSLLEIYERIKSSKNVLIITHRSPDGDAIGSANALSLIIKKLNIPVTILVTDIPDFVSLLPNIDNIVTVNDKEYDLMIMVDVSSKQQLGVFEELYDLENKIIIDHHNVQLDDSIMHYVDSSAASTTMIIYELIQCCNIEMDYDIAVPLYLGLLTDTGGFAHNNTTSEVFLVASKLLEFGIGHNEFYEKLIRRDYTIDYLYLKRKVIENLEIIYEKIAFSFLDFDTISKNEYDTPKDLVHVGRGLVGVEASVLIIEENPNSYRVSLRSNKYLDVSAVAGKFGGGGHKNASGIRFNDDYDLMKEKIVEAIKNELN